MIALHIPVILHHTNSSVHHTNEILIIAADCIVLADLFILRSHSLIPSVTADVRNTS